MSSTGCTLPEDLRRYYLDAMGIQLWQQRDSVEVQSAVDEIPVDKEIIESTGIDEPPRTTDRSGEDTTRSDWERLEQAVVSCTKCELHQSRTQTVFGTGDRHADLLIIGEAPGRDEDLRGEPFVGRAGQLLNAMLLAIGFQREQVYIANILKCRPPNNRDPRVEEAAACSPYLQAQIELIRPKVILALGRIAAHNLLNTDQKVGALRGHQHSYAGVPLIVSYHPAYLLRSPIEKRKSWQDLKVVMGLLK
jgi:uracil-DNA glycosylase